MPSADVPTFAGTASRVKAWRDGAAYKEVRKIGDKYRSYAIDGVSPFKTLGNLKAAAGRPYFSVAKVRADAANSQSIAR
jgi:hypothetical protein